MNGANGVSKKRYLSMLPALGEGLKVVFISRRRWDVLKSVEGDLYWKGESLCSEGVNSWGEV